MPHQRTGPRTSVRMRFSNRCRASGVQSVRPPIRPPQRQLAENIRFQGPPLIRLRRRRRNRRPLILLSRLAMTPTRPAETETWLETAAGLRYTAQIDYLRFMAIILFCTSSYHASCIPKMVRIFHCVSFVFQKKFHAHTQRMMIERQMTNDA